jgi:hypothetical protein
MTALTLYGSSIASTTLTTADQFATTTGGTETSKTTSVASAAGNGYLEVLSQGGSGTIYTSIPAPTGRGWLFDVTTLEGQTLASGNWSGSVGLADTAGSGPLLSIIAREYKRSSAGVYTSIGTLTLSGPTITTTRTTFSLPSTSFASMAFATGDKLYVDLFIDANGWGGDFIVNDVSNSTSAGVVNDMQIVSPGYAPTVVPSTASVTEINPVKETVTTASVQFSAQSVTESNAVIEQVASQSLAVATAGTPGGVRLLINDVYYPTILRDSIAIDRTANDPIPTFKITIQDDPSNIAISELEEVIFLDAGQVPNPTHNLLRNPVINPYATNWTAATTPGGTIMQASPGVTLTASTIATSFGLSQISQNGLVVGGQTYMLSCWMQSSLTNLNSFLTITYLSATGATLTSQSLALGSSASAQYSVSLIAPTGSTSAQISFGLQLTNITNSGSCTFWNIQFEPMSFTTGIAQQYYPTPFCANGQVKCLLMPDGTSIRQYRLFGGYVTKATAQNYIGNNRQWSVQVSGYAWLLQKQILNDNFTNQTDAAMLKSLINKYFPNQFNTAMISTGSTLDLFGYTYNGTFRDAIDALSANSGFYFYVDAYRAVIYQPPGYNTLDFMLSDRNPDGVTSFQYYSYSLDIDGTQLGNACIVTGATGIAAIEYDGQSIGYYNQKTNGQGIFWRSVSDSTIASTAAARQRAIAEIAMYGYAVKTAHVTTNQPMIPGYSILFTSVTDDLIEVPMLIQKASIVLKGFRSIGIPTYEYACDLGAWSPDGVAITVKLLKNQLLNSNSIGTPVIGLMVTENMTFVDTISVKQVTAMPSTYGRGTYGSSTYAFAVPSIPPTQYGSGTYGDLARGYA